MFRRQEAPFRSGPGKLRGIVPETDGLHPLFEIPLRNERTQPHARTVAVHRIDRTVQQCGDGRRVGDAQPDQREDAQFGREASRTTDPDARIGVRRPGSLTTELRIFALVRLGITDTATIAALLHCSVNTVYSYRSRMRLRSLVPERDFEQRVQSIGLWDDAAELSGT